MAGIIGFSSLRDGARGGNFTDSHMERCHAMKRRELMKYTLAAAAPATLLGAASSARLPQPGGALKDVGAVPDARVTSALTVPASGDIRVAFLISAGAELVDFVFPWGVFEYVLVGNRNPFKLNTVAVTKDPVKVSGGMTVLPDYTCADAPTPDVVVVPAMDTDKLAPAALDWLRSVHKDATLTTSVCNGSFVLAEAGLLDGKRATSHHSGYGMLRAMYPKVTVIRGVRYVEDGKIATSGGLTSGMDLAMRVVERYFGRDVAKETALSLEYQSTGWMFPASNAQFAKAPVSTAEHPVCEVCYMQLSREVAETLQYQYQGKTYFFCSESHKQSFVADPRWYLQT
jgi:putative intracellular protease/amidase/YHS domain-containing protein